MAKGSLFIISGPSGTGKGAVCKRLIEEDNIFLSVSATTRDKRAGETEGVTYFYITREEFLELIDKGVVLEYAEYGGNFYGTPKKAVRGMLAAGKNVILEIEVQGALKVKELMPEAVMIFVVPPSIEELKFRLNKRGRENEEEIAKRLETAKWEFSKASLYNYVIVNDDITKCVEETLSIINQTNESQKMIERLLSEM